MNSNIPLVLDAGHRRVIVGEEPMIFHCHHYNTFLQHTIQLIEDIDSQPFLVGAAAEVAFSQLSKFFSELGLEEVDSRKAFAQKIFSWAGFGKIDLSSLNENGGNVSVIPSHYAFAWRVKFGVQKKARCCFDEGWTAGAAAAIFGSENGSFSATETKCGAVSGSDDNEIEVKKEAGGFQVFTSVGVGTLSSHNLRDIPETPVDYDGIFDALTGMEIVGNEKGLIPAFGVYLTRHFANYYNRISFEFEKALSALIGKEGLDAARPLLIEAGHVCAFNTFGGIMNSTEWDALIKPTLVTKEDWVHGIIAATNALGWGRWQVISVSEEEAEFVIHDDYESVGYLAMYGKSDHPISYLVEGGVVGIMELVYVGEIEKKPDLSESFYHKLFKLGGSYQVKVLSSKAMGDEVTSFKVFKKRD